MMSHRFHEKEFAYIDRFDIIIGMIDSLRRPHKLRLQCAAVFHNGFNPKLRLVVGGGDWNAPTTAIVVLNEVIC